MKPVILLDVDGVLADFVGAYLQLLEDVLGLRRTRDQIRYWDIGLSLDLTPEQSSRMKKAIDERAMLARSLAVHDGSHDGVRMLQELGELYIVTSPWNSNPTWTHDRERWLRAHFDIPHSRVIHTSAKHLVRGDVFIDDKASAVAKWREANPQGLAILWSTPHNQTESWDGQCTSEWGFVHKLIELHVNWSSSTTKGAPDPIGPTEGDMPRLPGG